MYKIVGADQREYGPSTSEQVREWITQGRANAQTLASYDGSPWKPLSTYPEFADMLRAAVPQVPPTMGQPPYPGAATFVGARTNTAAVSGLVLCIIGCCWPLGILGLILCVIGLVQIQRTPQESTTTKVIPILGIAIALMYGAFNVMLVASGAFEQIMKSLQR